MKRNNFIEHVWWFSGFTDTILPTLQAACHSLHCFTSEQVLHPSLCTLQDYVESCWKLSLKTTRNVSFQYHEKHRHYRSHIFFMPSAHEKTKGKDFGMPSASSSDSFTQSVFPFHCCISREGWQTAAVLSQLFCPVIFGTQVFTISWKMPQDILQCQVTLHRFIHSD